MLFRFAACAALLASAHARNIVRQGSVTAAEDVTVTVTVTAKNPPTSTVFETTTIFKTVFSTIVVTKTQITTETETKKDVATATSVIYTTVTQNAKRWINADPAPAAAREVPPATLTVDAAPGPQTTPIEDFMGGPNVELLVRKAIIAKRATVTTTVTVIADGITTVFRTVSSTVVSTTSSETTSISKLTTTTFENAKTTVTVTSTLFLKTTTVTTGPAQTVDSVPPDANIGTDNPQATDSSNSGKGGGSSKNKGGLSTGAKAGIGAAAGAVGLMIIVALAMYFWKQHKNKPKVTDDGTGMGMSEVPVGGIGAAGTSGAATETVGSTRFTPSPVTSTLPTGSPVYNTTGPAELGGLPKKPDAELEGDELPPDNTPVMDHRSGPVDPIYEMPAQEYR